MADIQKIVDRLQAIHDGKYIQGFGNHFHDELLAIIKELSMKQCPYCPATKCKMDEPCEGCETWSEYVRKEQELSRVKAELEAAKGDCEVLDWIDEKDQLNIFRDRYVHLLARINDRYVSINADNIRDLIKQAMVEG